MQPWSLAAIACLLAAALALFVGEEALADAHDLVALYWFATGAISLKASLALAQT
jgi:hypothetical protein